MGRRVPVAFAGYVALFPLLLGIADPESDQVLGVDHAARVRVYCVKCHADALSRVRVPFSMERRWRWLGIV